MCRGYIERISAIKHVEKDPANSSDYDIYHTLDPDLNFRQRNNMQYNSLYCANNADLWDDSLCIPYPNYTCRLCSRVFNNPDSCMQHFQIFHITEYKYSCHICSTLFYLDTDLAAHAPIHNGHAIFLCYCCDLRFKSAEELSEHSANHIIDAMIAQDAFKTMTEATIEEEELTLMMTDQETEESTPVVPVKIISDEVVFTCLICVKVFESADRLDRHIRMKHRDRPEKHYECELCEKVFGHKGLLKAHQKEHTSYRCGMCGQYYASLRMLKSHSKLHLGETILYKCCHCGMLSRDRAAYKRHVKEHEETAVVIE